MAIMTNTEYIGILNARNELRGDSGRGPIPRKGTRARAQYDEYGEMLLETAKQSAAWVKAKRA